ncbi:MAG TPA: hypothetical protein PKE55_01940 [Kiritimatiellia bacterium]|nr:hypothetical protein [Kiritimatiellia bacterium]
MNAPPTRPPETTEAGTNLPLPEIVSRIAAIGYIGLALSFWIIYAPGNFSDDTIDQIQQGVHGTFRNTHPPFLAILVSILQKLNFSISVLAIVQAILGVFGLRYFLSNLLAMVYGRILTPVKREACIAMTILVLVLFTPLSVYWVTVIKDMWLVIFLGWTGGYLIACHQRATWTVQERITLLLLITLACIQRYNAVLLFFSFVPLIYVIMPTRKALWAALTLTLYIATSSAIHHGFSVKDETPTNQVRIVDMLGMAVLEPGILDHMPFLRSHLHHEDFASIYRFGAQGYVHHFMNYNGAMWDDPPQLEKEYRSVVVRHPLLWLRVKIKAYHSLLGQQDHTQSFYSGIWYGGKRYDQNPQYQGFRKSIEAYLDRIESLPGLGLFQRHVFWINLNLLLLVMAIHSRARAWVILLLLIPLIYAGSFLAATVATAHRMLYPSTLLMQTATVGLMVSGLFARKLTGSFFPEWPSPTSTSPWDRLKHPALLVSILAVSSLFLWWPAIIPGKPSLQESGPTSPPTRSSGIPQTSRLAFWPRTMENDIREWMERELPGGNGFILPPSQPDSAFAVTDKNPHTLAATANIPSDSFIGAIYPQPVAIGALSILLHRDAEGLGLRDFSILAAEPAENPANLTFRLIRARLDPRQPFANLLTLPPDLNDFDGILIELDPTDRDWQAYHIWGIGSLTQSRGHLPSHRTSRDHRSSIRGILYHAAPPQWLEHQESLPSSH